MSEMIKNENANQVEAENKMGVMPMNKLLITMSLPMMVSMLVQALYNIVDSIFVSRICEDALTAVSMAFPMQNLMIGVGAGLGVGMSALLSKALGAGDVERANNAAKQGLFLGACGYGLFLVLGLTISRFFFEIQGASESIAQYGEDYLFYVTVLSFGLFGQMMMERLLQATGRTIYSMYTQGTGAIINMIMDPILIFGYFGLPALGIKGAAIATIFGQLVAAGMGYYFNRTRNKELHITLKNFRPDGAMIGNILFIGVPSVLMIAIGSVMTFSMNKILVVFSSTAVAVFGVYYKLQSFAFMPVIGLNNGMVPITAYNYGAKKYDRMYSARKYAILYAEIIMTLAFAVVQLFPETLLQLFDASETMVSLGVPALRIIATHFMVAGFCVISSSFFQALGHSVYSMVISFVRQLVFLVPLAYLFSQTGNVEMVWWAWPIAEIASATMCVIFMNRVKKTIETM